ncbi:MAG: hypothetical protein LW720_04195 [Pirellula sp.]|jgi:hypothetical protein|nr:hypothetical protein [Pirellula sp.]
MAFLDGCACHVWAIDGWVNDILSREVNENYAEVGTGIAMGTVHAATLDAKVALLLNRCRISPAVAQAGTLYGGFQAAGDGSPTHMWFEHGGYVYDTMPGSALRRIAASALTRLRPPSEAAAFAQRLVGSTPFSLTESQYRLISGANIVWANGVLAGRNVEYYTP